MHRTVPQRRAWLRDTAIAFVAIIAAAVASQGADRIAQASSCPGPGLQNGGFEVANNESDPVPCWDVTAPDSVRVITTESAPSANGSVTIAPRTGLRMVRLGTPKLSNQKQVAGENSVRQVFTPTSSTLKLAVRLLSWEHRGTDSFRIALERADSPSTTAGTLTPFTLSAGSTTAVSCTTLPCVSTIDVGKSGDFLDTGWTTVTITGITVGLPARLVVGAGGTGNQSTATWLYVDAVNQPPIADFRCLYTRVDLGNVEDLNTDPATTSGCRLDALTGDAGPLEGSPVQLNDTSTDPDGPDDIIGWDWTVTGPGLPQPLLLRSQTPFFFPPQDGDYTVELKITDQGGLSSTKTRHVQVLNAPPLANAIDVEYLEGYPVNVLGRFSDSGWLDQHAAKWDGVDGSIEEDNSAALASGRVTGTLPLAAGEHVLTVSDDSGADSSDSFTVSEVSDTPESRQRHEPNDAVPAGSGTASPGGAVPVDSAILSFLQSSGDRDVFEIGWPGTSGDVQPIPAGAEILTTLRNLPADYDLVLVAVPAPSQSAGYSFSGFSFSGFSFSGFSFSELPSLENPFAAGYSFSGQESAGFSFSALERSAYVDAGYSFSGYSFSGFSFSGFSFSGYSFSDATIPAPFAPYAVTGYSFSPISQQAFTGLDSAAITSADMSATELKIGQLPPGAQVVGFSARNGTADEVVTTRVDVPGTRLFAIVLGSNGAYSSDPYTLQLEGSMSLVTAAIAAGNTDVLANVCPPRDISTDAPNTPFSYDFGAGPADPKTLILTNLDRIRNLNQDDPAWAPSAGAGSDSLFVKSLKDYASNSLVDARIVDLGEIAAVTAAYQELDALPCDIQRANAVTEAIRAVIDDELAANPDIEYVVIAGDDDVVPFRRVPDETTISNERYYLGSSYVKPGTPLFASIKDGFNLTDDFYVDELPTPWQGRLLFIPDRVNARLVETPSEISGQIESFLTSGGVLRPSASEEAFVAGYDFFTDGANVVADALTAANGGTTSVRTLIADDWTAEDLSCHLLGEGCASAPLAIATISNPNAHFTHYAALAAHGFNAKEYGDYLTSSAVRDAGGGSGLERVLLMTIGCHAGFSAPDGSTIEADPIFGFDSKLDFAQAVALQRGILIASTGFGLGETEGLGGTELLLTLLAETLRDRTTGKALLAAKVRYITEQANPSVYDEKSSIQVVHYGIPHYASGLNAAAEVTQVAAEQVADAPIALDYPGLAAPATGTSTQHGSYFEGPDGADGAPFRPLQPRDIVDLGVIAEGDEAAHGVIINSATFRDIPHFDPVISRPAIEWEQNPTEPQVCVDAFTPSSIVRVNSLETPEGLRQTLVLTPAHFRCDTEVYEATGHVTGIERLYPDVDLQILRSGSGDVTAPAVSGIDLRKLSNGNVELTVTATDHGTGAVPASGLGRIVVLRIGEGTMTTAADVSVAPAENPWTAKIAFGETDSAAIRAGDGLIIQVADVAGNVTWYSGKGSAIRFIDFDAAAGPVVAPTNTVTFSTTLDAAVVAKLAQPAFYTWTFGDGGTATGQLDCPTEPDGTCVVTVVHTFSEGTEFAASLRIVDADGGIGTDDVQVRICLDPADDHAGSDAFRDLIGCSAASDGTSMTIILTSRGPILNSSGVPFDDKTQYRVYLNSGAGGTFVEAMRYSHGVFSGVALPRSEVVNLGPGLGSEIRYHFLLADIDWAGEVAGTELRFYAEVQAGLSGVPTAGIGDRLPDAGGIVLISP